jgi:hypothetical protein
MRLLGKVISSPFLKIDISDTKWREITEFLKCLCPRRLWRINQFIKVLEEAQ